MHYVPPNKSLLDRVGSLVHTTFSLAGMRPPRAAAVRQPEGMLEWSDVDIAVRDAVREFVDKEVRPHVDALESGEMEPYPPIIRKLFSTFGIADMARDSLTKRLARLRDGDASSQQKPSSGGMFGGGGAPGMGVRGRQRAVPGVDGRRHRDGRQPGGAHRADDHERGTLAQQERWLPDLVTYDKVGAWAITEPDSGSTRSGGA